MSGDDIVCHWHGLGLIESDDGWSCSACTKPSNVKALLAEIERLRAAIDAVLLAITDKGSHPEYHDEVRRRHEREWPTLWRAIAGLREARRAR